METYFTKSGHDGGKIFQFVDTLYGDVSDGHICENRGNGHGHMCNNRGMKVKVEIEV